MHIAKRGAAWAVLATALLVAGCDSGDSGDSSAARTPAATGSPGGGTSAATPTSSPPPTLPGGGVLVTGMPSLPQTHSAAPTTQTPSVPSDTVTAWVTAMRNADAGAPRRPELEMYREAFNFLVGHCLEKPEEVKAYVMRIAPASTQDVEGKHYYTLSALGAMNRTMPKSHCVQTTG